MPTRAGTADKFGNRYEALWAIDCLLTIVDGRATNLKLEPVEKDESRGIEFYYTLNDGHVSIGQLSDRQPAHPGGLLICSQRKMKGDARS